MRRLLHAAGAMFSAGGITAAFGSAVALVAHRRSRAGRHVREILSDNDRIELLVRSFGQAMPCLVTPEQSDAEIAAHGERLPVGADAHHRVVNVAITRIEDVAAL